MADLKGDLRNSIAEACKKEGLPPVIEKTLGSIWDQFKKSMPSKLSEKGLDDGWKDKLNVWENLSRCLEKYGVHKKIVEIAIKKLKAKYGEEPTETQVKLMIT